MSRQIKTNLIERTKAVLQAYNRPYIRPEEVLLILKGENVDVGSLTQELLEAEIRWTVLFRIERSSDKIPSWRNEINAEDDFFE